MTLWYGAALGVVLVFFSAATYVRYRQEAWRSFDVDLRNNLDTLDGEVHEELREARAAASSPSPGGAPAARDPLVRAALQSLEEFRLNALAAEIRNGRRGADAARPPSGSGRGRGPPVAVLRRLEARRAL